MTEPKIRIKYMAGGAVYEEKKAESPNYSLDLICTDEGVKLTINPKREIELISVALKFEGPARQRKSSPPPGSSASCSP